jgi:putative transposase
MKAGRDPQPSARIRDSQSVKTTGVGGVRGDDGAKKLSGRKRHRHGDPQGLVLRAKVHSAAIQDRAAVPWVLEDVAAEFPWLEHVRVDQGYRGSGKAWTEAQLGWSVAVVGHPPQPRGVSAPIGAVIDWNALRPKGFRGVLPRRWVIESSQLQYPYTDNCFLSYDWPDRLVESRHPRGKIPASGRGRERERMSPHVLPPRP